MHFLQLPKQLGLILAIPDERVQNNVLNCKMKI